LNILSRTRNKASKHKTVPVVLLPIPSKIFDVVFRDVKQRQLNNVILCDLIKVICVPIVALETSGLEVQYAGKKVVL